MNQQKGSESLKFLPSLKLILSDDLYGWCLVATSRRCPGTSMWSLHQPPQWENSGCLGGIFTMKKHRWQYASNESVSPLLLTYSSKGPDLLCFLSCRPLPLAPWPSKSPHICTQRCYIHHLQLPKDSLDCNMGASPLQNTLLTAKVGRVNKDLSIRIDIEA